MDARQRRDLQRYGAPAAFLTAVTIAVLLIKSGLGGGHDGTTGLALPPAATSTKTGRTTTRVATTTAARYYTIQSGDTLGSVASAQNTSVGALVRLNPGIDPKALHVGQRIRVG